MNDNDIIKALGFCESPTCECTSECPMFYNGTNSKSDCRGELHKNALRLINRLKSEIEEQDQAIINALHHMKEIRTEAIKEFAERLQEDLINSTLWGLVSFDRINNLVKKMTEGDSEEN